MVFVLGVFLVLVFSLFVRWKTRYRYPPDDVPPVLCYHKLSRRFCLEGTWTTPRRFIDQIDSLLAGGYRFIGEDEFYEALAHRSPDHGRTILLTFDDGYEELYGVFTEHLVPRGIPVLVFLVADYVGKGNVWDLSLGRRAFKHLSWDQVSRMAGRGATFGSHGAGHVDLTRVANHVLEREIVESRRVLSGRTGSRVRSFSYPFGRYNAAVEAAVAQAGYDGAFSLYPRHSNEHVERFALRRNGVYVIDTNLTLRWKLERTPFFWFEEMKCRTINSVAVLTPILKRYASGRGK
jgi:peptidoglycan/xylan/chitin deacetylase (PgdA/CDA1 family)